MSFSDFVYFMYYDPLLWGFNYKLYVIKNFKNWYKNGLNAFLSKIGSMLKNLENKMNLIKSEGKYDNRFFSMIIVKDMCYGDKLRINA
jgi:hypothetical protein